MALPPSGLLCRPGTRLSAPDPSPLRIRPRPTPGAATGLARDETELGEDPEAARRGLRASAGGRRRRAAPRAAPPRSPRRPRAASGRARRRRPARPAARRGPRRGELDLGQRPRADAGSPAGPSSGSARPGAASPAPRGGSTGRRARMRRRGSGRGRGPRSRSGPGRRRRGPTRPSTASPPQREQAIRAAPPLKRARPVAPPARAARREASAQTASTPAPLETSSAIATVTGAPPPTSVRASGLGAFATPEVTNRPGVSGAPSRRVSSTSKRCHHSSSPHSHACSRTSVFSARLRPAGRAR